MGAAEFFNTIDAETPEEGYNRLCERAIEEYGNDPYNGTISTTRLYGCSSPNTSKFTSTAAKKALKAAREADFGRKGNCRAIDLGVVGYQVCKIKKDTSYKSTSAPKYITRFVLCDWCGNRIGNDSYANQTEAKAALISLFKRGKVEDTSWISIEKRPVLVEGRAEISRFVIETKMYKTRPKKIATDAVCKEIHRYAYYGLAYC